MRALVFLLCFLPFSLSMAQDFDSTGFEVDSVFVRNISSLFKIADHTVYEALQNAKTKLNNCLKTELNDDVCHGLNDLWVTEKTPAKFAFISVGGILTPIEIEKEEVVYRNLTKDFEFSQVGNTVTRVSSTNVVNVTSSNIIKRQYRPTLFISLQGASFANSDGRGFDGSSLAADVATFLRGKGTNYNMAVWSISWDSIKPMREQVKMLRRKVNSFLKSKQYAWDVAIIGFSRGGLFANELANQLENNGKVNRLYSVLLDPTAAHTFNDVYPRRASNGPSRHNFLLYDGQAWSPYFGEGFAIGDQSIEGYPQATLIGANHNDVPVQFISDGHLAYLFEQTESNKIEGDFAERHYHQEEIVRIGLSKDLDINIEINDGVFVNANLGPVYFTTQTFVGDGNLHTGASVSILANFYSSVGEDGVSMNASVVGMDIGLTTDGVDGIRMDFDAFNAIGVNAELSTHDAYIEFEIMGKDLKLDATGAIEGVLGEAGDILDGAGNVISSAARSISNAFSKVFGF